jgi:effector-binding domain-containing protein
MIDPPFIVETKAQLVAKIPLKIPRDQIRHVMGPGIGEIFQTLRAQKINPAGPWLCHHLKMSPDVFDFEICVPVSTEIVPTGRVLNGIIPAAKVARTVMHGDYSQLAQAWPKLIEWMESQGHKPAQNLWEVYVKGPESTQIPADYRTELNRPLLNH